MKVLSALYLGILYGRKNRKLDRGGNEQVMSAAKCNVEVELGERSYTISIGSGLLSDAALLREYIAGDQIFLVTNETIAPLYLNKLLEQIDVKNVNHIILPDGERFKNLATMQLIYDALLENKCSRGVTLVALGGGVIGDMTGFAAATYQRGVKFVQVPTTLLAQVDSSVGGKTGVNHAAGKNMVGAFYQPISVIIDIQTLNTLPDREFRAGLAEVIKYGLICDAEFFDWLQVNISKLLNRDAEALKYAIARCCENKAKVVAADETETGIRAILNFGHTFGHAIETATQYKVWLHGEAVGFGMLMALDLSVRMGEVPQAEADKGRSLIIAAGLPSEPPANMPDTEGMLALMARDKKVMSGQLRLVLLEKLGVATVTADFSMSKLKQTLAVYFDY